MPKFRCPECGWAVTEFREKTQNMVCLRCGHKAEIEKFKEEAEPKIKVSCPIDGYQDVRYLFRENLYKCLRCGYKGTRKEFIKKIKVKA